MPNTQGGALLPTNNGGQNSGLTLGQQVLPAVPVNFGNTLPTVPNPSPAPPKTLTVVTPQAAQTDLAQKQDTTTQVSNAVGAQTQNNLSQVGVTSATTQPQTTQTQTLQQPQTTPAPTNTSTYAPPAGAQAVTLPNGVQAYYDGTTQNLTTSAGTQLQWNDAQGAWIDPSTGQPPAPVGTSATGVPATGDPTTDYINQQLQANQASADQASATHQQQLQQILNGTFPLTADQQQQVAGLQAQFAQLEQLQKTANDNFTGATTVLGVRSGREQYAPEIAQGQITAAVSQGVQKMQALDTQAATAVSTLKQGFMDNDYKVINQAYADLTVAIQAKDDTLTKMQQTIKDGIDAQTAKIQQQTATLANTTAKVTSLAASALQQSLTADGTIDLDELQKIADANGIDENVLYGAVQKEQQAETVAQQGDAKFASDQLQAQAMLAKTQADTANTQASTKKTYADMAATATTAGDVNDPSTVDPSSQSILAQTGLSVAAFNYLTQGTAALSRLSATDRKAIMNEASAFLNKNGLDYSTFQSQYKAQNNVLQSNIERAANTKIFAGEVSGTAQQFIDDVGDDISNLKPAAVATLFATGQTNDKTAQKYAFDLQTMQNDLAGYYAASRGSSSPDQSDLTAAANVITQGLSGKGAQAFKDSIDANEKKVTTVVNNSVTDAQKSIWGQFGVADKYNPASSTTGAGNTSGFTPKGSTSASDFVANTFKTLYPGQTEQQLMDYHSAALQAGEQLAFDNNTGDVVAATKADIASGKYTPI